VQPSVANGGTMLKRLTPASMFESQLRKGFKLDKDRPKAG